MPTRIRRSQQHSLSTMHTDSKGGDEGGERERERESASSNWVRPALHLEAEEHLCPGEYQPVPLAVPLSTYMDTYMDAVLQHLHTRSLTWGGEHFMR
jgi:hypothetical protein